MKKLLIIKTGESETLNEQSSSYCSLGDVVRHFGFLTHLKEIFPDHEIYWLTHKNAIGLFKVLHESLNIMSDLSDIEDQSFDHIVNFEKGSSYLAYISKYVNKTIGFINQNKIRKVDGKEDDYSFFPDYKVPFEDEVFRLFGLRSSKVSVSSKFSEIVESNDIGLNWKSGKKWPQKALSKEVWDNIYQETNSHLEVSWQEGFDNIEQYIGWIASCRMLITLDSLGMHIANLLGKNIIALFGPTSEQQIKLKNGVKLHYVTNYQKEFIVNEVLNKVAFLENYEV